MSAKAKNDEAPTERHFLTKAEILAAEDRRHEELDVPAWGGWLIVWSMTGIDRDSYEAEMVATGDDDRYDLSNLRAKLVARSIGDEQGTRLFSESEIEILGLKDAAALEQVAAVARRVSRLRKADITSARIAMGKDPSSSRGTA